MWFDVEHLGMKWLMQRKNVVELVGTKVAASPRIQRRPFRDGTAAAAED
jgi:hypothetical protein